MSFFFVRTHPRIPPKFSLAIFSWVPFEFIQNFFRKFIQELLRKLTGNSFVNSFRNFNKNSFGNFYREFWIILRCFFGNFPSSSIINSSLWTYTRNSIRSSFKKSTRNSFRNSYSSSLKLFQEFLWETLKSSYENYLFSSFTLEVLSKFKIFVHTLYAHSSRNSPIVLSGIPLRAFFPIISPDRWRTPLRVLPENFPGVYSRFPATNLPGIPGTFGRSFIRNFSRNSWKSCKGIPSEVALEVPSQISSDNPSN